MITLTPTIVDLKDALKFFFSCLDVARPKAARLTQSEVDMLVDFIMLPPKFKYYRFSSPAKKAVIKSSEQKLSIANINNKLYSLIEKGIIYRDDDKVLYMDKSVEQATSVLVENFSALKPTSIVFNIAPVEKEDATSKGL